MQKSSKMLIHCGLLLLFLNCVRTTEYVNSNNVINKRVAEYNDNFVWWPSVHNAANVYKVKRQAEQSVIKGNTEGGTENLTVKSVPSPPALPSTDNKAVNATKTLNSTTTPPVVENAPVAPPVSSVVPISNSTETSNSTAAVTEKPKQLNLNNPGVIKRGFIVFGGFALMAAAYFIFYRRKGKNNDTGNTSTNDANQFRYGVLQSEDRRDNMELSRVPLTMESDDDEDEDLEIFDLEQKKKSLSYVNLQTNDEDLVFAQRDNVDNDRDNLLLDIEDGNTDTLINWSGNGSKSIL